MGGIVVVGQVGRDLVLEVDGIPPEGGSAPVRRRRELLGGKGANQAVGCRQLGVQAALVAVVGADAAGADALAAAAADGIDVTGVVRRDGAATALLVDVVGPPGIRRLLEDVPEEVLLRPDDVRAAAALLGGAEAVLLQLQQPGPAVAEALRAAAPGSLVVADGAPGDERVRELVLARADAVRADTAETAALTGRAPEDTAGTLRAARELLGRGPRVVALASPEGADVVAWPGGHVVLPHLEPDPVDPTGGGDAFVAALAVGLLHGEEPGTAARWAAAASAQVAGTAGGRPGLSPGLVRRGAPRG